METSNTQRSNVVIGDSRPSVCTMVLTYNNLADTNECLASLAAQEYSQHQTLVVDNGSTDGSLAALRTRWEGRVRFVETGHNLGCGGGYNIGLRLAMEAGADYALIVDNDVVACPGLISALVDAAKNHPNAAAISPVILEHRNPAKIWFAGGYYSRILGYTRHRWLNQPVSRLGGSRGTVATSGYTPTCVLLIPRAVLEDVGLHDERFFFGHDDVDWCLRAQARGYPCLVLLEPLATHKISITGGVPGSTVFSSTSAYYHARESILVGVKHHSGLAFLPFLVGQFLVRMPYYCIQMAMSGRWLGVANYPLGLGAGLWRYLVSKPAGNLNAG